MWRQLNIVLRRLLGKPPFQVLFLNMAVCQQKFNHGNLDLSELRDGLFFLLDADRSRAFAVDPDDRNWTFPTPKGSHTIIFRRKFREALYAAEWEANPRVVWPADKTAENLCVGINSLLIRHGYQPIPPWDPSIDPPFLSKWLAKNVRKFNPNLWVIFELMIW